MGIRDDGTTIDKTAEPERGKSIGFKPDWPAPASVRAFVSTREGGCSLGRYCSNNLGAHVGDDSDAVANNRSQLVSALNIQAATWLQQVHGEQIVTAESAASLQEALQADAVITRCAGLACTIMTADCLPILLCDQQGTQVAAAHCGWRGLVNDLLPNIINHFGAGPDQLLAYLGPAISQAHYEVGPEVLNAVTQIPGASLWLKASSVIRETRPDHALLDLYELARLRLQNLGVAQIYGGNHCTFEEANLFYSYRRDGVTGRMASLIWLAEN